MCFDWKVLAGRRIGLRGPRAAGWGPMVYCQHMNRASPFSGHSPAFDLKNLFIFIYLCLSLRMLSDGSVIFPGVSASMSIGTQNYHAFPLSWLTHLNYFFIFLFFFSCWISFDFFQHTKLLCFPIVSGHSPAFVFFNYLFLFIYIFIYRRFSTVL